MELPLLYDIVVIFGVSAGMLFLCHRIRLPVVVGFLITGAFVGPHGFALVKSVHDVEIFAEIGVVLLLFTIGIEFSLEKLVRIRRSVLLGGSLQVGLTCLAAFFVARQWGKPPGEAVFLGFLAALSSTAIVLRIIQQRAEVDSPQGRTALGILIFQDIAIVPMILVTPLLSGAAERPGMGTFLPLLLKALFIILMVPVAARWIVPRILYQIARTRNQEIFLLTLILICFGTAWITSRVGLSLALGAFLAGVIISESEYSHHALGNVLPFRDVFTTFFFVSIGMLFDPGTVMGHPGTILMLTLGVLAAKAVIAFLATILTGLALRTAVMVGLSLSQIGEFSFILSREGLAHGLLGQEAYAVFLAVAALCMAVTPFLMALAPHLANRVGRWPFPERLRKGFFGLSEETALSASDHVLVIGFGVIGRNVAHAAKAARIPYAVIEMNPETVKKERASGEQIFYGDASQDAVLVHANVREARVAVVAINDPSSVRGIVEKLRQHNPRLQIIVRTRYIQEIAPLRELGADDVIPEEFETAVEIFTRVLAKYLVPREEIEKLVGAVRADGYEMLRGLSKGAPSLTDLREHLHDLDICTFPVSEGSLLAGKSLREMELRKNYGVSVVAIRREDGVIPNPDADTVLRPGDLLFVLGSCEKIPDAVQILSGPAGGGEGAETPPS